VLIVDDQEPFRVAAAAVVDATDGFVVCGAVDSGERCLEEVAQARPDLVLMDVNLPGMDGIECTQRLCEQDQPPAVVLVSTYDEGELGEHARDCGAAGYVPKSSFGPETLAAAWRVVVTG
jgi:DNA-binding NarL/FixJ family response regulator